MIQSLPCPGCHRTLVLAADASLKAVLRCRHCSHQFVLGEMIDSELGFWEVVDDPQAPEPKLAPSSNAEGASKNGNPDADLSVEDSEYVSPQALLKKQADKKNVDWSKFEPNTHEQFERMRRKNKSPIWSTLSVLLGGLASLPIATLLIWHLLGKDPLQMGPVVGRYVPWIVPAKFQSDPSERYATNPDSPPPGVSGFRKFDAVMENTEFSDPDSGADGLVDADTSSSSNPSMANTEVSSQNMNGRTRRVPQALPSSQDRPSAKNFLMPDPETLQNREDSIPESADNVFKLISEAEKSLESWSERSDDRETNKALAKKIYARLTSLAIVVETVPVTSPLRRLIRSELQSIGKMLNEQRDLRKLIQGVSRMELSSQPGASTNSNVGLAIVVDIENANEIEGQWEITTTASTSVGTPPTKIFAPIGIAKGLKTGQQILVLGTLAEEPSTAPAPAIDSNVSNENANVETNDASSDSTNADAAEKLESDKAEPIQQSGQRLNASFIFVLESAPN